MDYEQIRYAVEDGILTLTLHRPEKLNAFTTRMMHELLDLLRYGRGVDNRRLKRAGFVYRYTSAGAMENFVEAVRLQRAVGTRRPTYHYEQDVEQFFRHSPAVVRDSAST